MKSGWMEQNCRSRRFLLFAAVMTAAVLIAVPTTSAETLNEALASAYSGNPTLRAQRANQRSTDELVPPGSVRLAAHRHRPGVQRRRTRQQ
jgi:hypothetical protein